MAQPLTPLGSVFQTGFSWSTVLSNGTFVNVSDVNDYNNYVEYQLQLFTPSGTLIDSTEEQVPLGGFVDDAQVVALANGGFAVVFALDVFAGGQNYDEDWYADFYNSAGTPVAKSVLLLPDTPHGGENPGYVGTDVIAAPTANGGFVMAANYLAASMQTEDAPPGSPAGDDEHEGFPSQYYQVQGLLYDGSGDLTNTVIVNDVTKTATDGTLFSGLDTGPGSGVHVMKGGAAALGDGTLAVAYYDQQYQYLATQDGNSVYYLLQNTENISVDVITPGGNNLWIDVVHNVFGPTYNSPSVDAANNGPQVVALSADTFGVLWLESIPVSGSDPITDLMFESYDETGKVLTGATAIASGVSDEFQFQVTPLQGGNFAVAYYLYDTPNLGVETVSADGVVLAQGEIAANSNNLSFYSIVGAPDGSFYVTVSSATSPTGYLTQHFAGPTERAVWAAAVSGDFAVASNWDLAEVPGALNDVTIGAGVNGVGANRYAVTTSEDETIDSLSITAANGDAALVINGGTFTINNGTGSGLNNGEVDVYGGILSLDGTFENIGGFFTVSGGILELYGTISGGGVDTLGGGFIELNAGSSVAAIQGLEAGSEGVIDVESGGRLQIDAGTEQLGGPITVAVGGQIDLRFMTYASGLYAVWQQSNETTGTLSLIDHGTTLATLNLFGTYSIGGFGISNDNSNGVLITVQNPTAPYVFSTIYPPMNGLNDSGETVSSVADNQNLSHLAIYSNGNQTLLADPSAETSPSSFGNGEVTAGGTYGTGLNNLGQIVGYYTTADSDYIHGYLYSNDNWTTLDDPSAAADNTGTSPHAINNFGQIVGEYFDGNSQFHGFLYSNGTWATLDAPGASETDVVGINDLDEIVGTAFFSGSQQEGFIYSNGAWTFLQYPSALYNTQVDGINNSGEVLGTYQDTNGYHTFVYSDSVYSTVDNPEGGGALAINDYGDIVGTDDASQTGQGYAAATRVIAWSSAADGDFADPSNWSSTIVPTALDDAALLANSSFTASSDFDQTVNSIATSPGATLDVTGRTFTTVNGTAAGSNAGTLLVGVGGTLALGGYVDNLGMISALGGRIKISDTVSGTGSIEIGNKAVLELSGGGLITGNVQFTGPGATLQFDNTLVLGGVTQPESVQGDVIGAEAGDDFDFRFVPFVAGVEAEWQNGVLELDDNGTDRAQLNLSGSYVQDDFITTSDREGGTLVEVQGPTTPIPVGNGDTCTISANQSVTGLDVESGGVGVIDGGVSYAATVENGGALDVADGGVADPTIVSSGGSEVLSSGGTDVGAQLRGGIQLVFSGGTAEGASVLSGAEQYIGLGGTSLAAQVSGGGAEVVFGTDSGASLSGTQYDFGTASGGTTLNDGFQLVAPGAVATGMTVSSGGQQYIGAGGTAVSTNIASQGAQVVFGSALGALVSGTQYDFDYASGGTAFNNGFQQVAPGAVASGMTVASGGLQYIGSGGTAVATNIAAQGAQEVFGSALGTLVSGTQYDFSYASGGATYNNGYQLVAPGATAIAMTVESGGQQYIGTGGTALATDIAAHGAEVIFGTDSGALVSGTQYVFGVASGGSTLGGGSQQVEFGGTAIGMTVSSLGLQNVGGGGTAISTTIMSQGAETVHGTDLDASISGTQYVLGLASGTVVDAGGYQLVSAGGTISAASINGGTIELMSGASNGAAPISFTGAGQLILDASSLFSGTIAGFGSASLNDTIDFADVPYVAAGSAGATTVGWSQLTSGANASGTLTVAQGGHAADITLLGQYVAQNFTPSNDGHGGTLITDPPVAAATDPAPTPQLAWHNV